MRIVERGVVSELVMRNGSGRPEGGDVHVTNVAARPFVSLALKVLDEIGLGPIYPNCVLR